MRKRMTYFSFIVALVLLGCKNNDTENKEYEKVVKLENQIKRGKKLVAITGCNDCHSPKKITNKGPVPDPDRLLSGHISNEVLASYNSETSRNYVLFNRNNTAAIGPWGTSFAANLTPDVTGIGSWSEEQFSIAMRQGKYKGIKGGRQLLPPMPWQAYSQMSDEDIKAIFTYLKSLKPVKNIVPQVVPPVLL